MKNMRLCLYTKFYCLTREKTWLKKFALIFDSIFDLDPSILLFGFDSALVTKLWYSPQGRISSRDPAWPIYDVSPLIIMSMERKAISQHHLLFCTKLLRSGLSLEVGILGGPP